jgi:hypothetical protein
MYAQQQQGNRKPDDTFGLVLNIEKNGRDLFEIGGKRFRLRHFQLANGRCGEIYMWHRGNAYSVYQPMKQSDVFKSQQNTKFRKYTLTLTVVSRHC